MKQSLRLSAITLALGLLAAVAVPLAAADDGDARIEPTWLVAHVFYRTGTGNVPLAGVEVFALIDGAPYYRCTNDKGKAVFDNLGFGATLQTLATGPSVNSPRCPNTLFLNPDSGDKMFAVLYKNHQGVYIADPVDLPAGKTSLTLAAKTPHNQRRICAGFKTTMLGTPGVDGLIGTPNSDIINGRGGDDVIDGLGGNDLICGGPGADVISGGFGDDSLWGEGGADTIGGGDGADWIDGGPRKDTCLSAVKYFSCELPLP